MSDIPLAVDHRKAPLEQGSSYPLPAHVPGGADTHKMPVR